MFCPHCGTEVNSDDRFCRSCGKALSDQSAPDARDDAPTDETTSTYGYDEKSSFESIPVIGKKRVNAWEVERERIRNEPDDEWTMSDLGPPPPQKNRRWLWAIIATLSVIVLLCCIGSYWLTMTDSGQNWADGIMTQAAEQQATATATHAPTTSPVASPAP